MRVIPADPGEPSAVRGETVTAEEVVRAGHYAQRAGVVGGGTGQWYGDDLTDGADGRVGVVRSGGGAGGLPHAPHLGSVRAGHRVGPAGLPVGWVGRGER